MTVIHARPLQPGQAPPAPWQTGQRSACTAPPHGVALALRAIHAGHGLGVGRDLAPRGDPGAPVVAAFTAPPARGRALAAPRTRARPAEPIGARDPRVLGVGK